MEENYEIPSLGFLMLSLIPFIFDPYGNNTIETVEILKLILEDDAEKKEKIKESIDQKIKFKLEEFVENTRKYFFEYAEQLLQNDFFSKEIKNKLKEALDKEDLEEINCLLQEVYNENKAEEL